MRSTVGFTEGDAMLVQCHAWWPAGLGMVVMYCCVALGAAHFNSTVAHAHAGVVAWRMFTRTVALFGLGNWIGMTSLLFSLDFVATSTASSSSTTTTRRSVQMPIQLDLMFLLYGVFLTIPCLLCILNELVPLPQTDTVKRAPEDDAEAAASAITNAYVAAEMSSIAAPPSIIRHTTSTTERSAPPHTTVDIGTTVVDGVKATPVAEEMSMVDESSVVEPAEEDAMALDDVVADRDNIDGDATVTHNGNQKLVTIAVAAAMWSLVTFVMFNSLLCTLIHTVSGVEWWAVGLYMLFVHDTTMVSFVVLTPDRFGECVFAFVYTFGTTLAAIVLVTLCSFHHTDHIMTHSAIADDTYMLCVLGAAVCLMLMLGWTSFGDDSNGVAACDLSLLTSHIIHRHHHRSAVGANIQAQYRRRYERTSIDAMRDITAAIEQYARLAVAHGRDLQQDAAMLQYISYIYGNARLLCVVQDWLLCALAYKNASSHAAEARFVGRGDVDAIDEAVAYLTRSYDTYFAFVYVHYTKLMRDASNNSAVTATVAAVELQIGATLLADMKRVIKRTFMRVMRRDTMVVTALGVDHSLQRCMSYFWNYYAIDHCGKTTADIAFANMVHLYKKTASIAERNTSGKAALAMLMYLEHPPNQTDARLIADIEHVLRTDAAPLSLFDRLIISQQQR